MINIPRITLAWLLLCSCSFAQFSTTVETKLGVTGYVDVSLIGDPASPLLLVGQASKPVQTAVGIVSFETPLVEPKLRIYSAGQLIPTRRLPSQPKPPTILHSFAIDRSGTFVGLITGVDFDKKIFLDEDIPEFTIGPPKPPDPPPIPPDPPAPPVPTDPFDNIGQRVASWSVGLPKRKEVAEAYRLGAWQLANPPPQPVPPNYPITINEVAAQIGVTKAQVLGLDSVKWKALTENVNADTQGRWPMDRLSLSEYWVCVALGLEAQ